MSKKKVTRRGFLKLLGGTTASLFMSRFIPKVVFASDKLEPIKSEMNPLETYPNRDWEQVYRDLYSTDSSYIWLCAPNDTHGCLLRAHVKNGVVKYIDPSFGYGKATDVYGNQASSRWDPRICPNGHTYVRRCYSDRRVKGAYIRTGYKDWVDAGRPRESDGLPKREYFLNRGKDTWENVSFDEAYTYIAGSLKNVAETYTGTKGKDYLLAQGYHPAMVEKTKTDSGEYAGIRTLKFRASMAWLSAMRFTGLYRFANSLALLDANIRGVGPDEATGPRSWDSYSWHTDLPPGHPMVHGNKTIDFDLFAAEYSNLITLWGMNWIATKMVESHWLTEARIRGAKVITIATEYQSTSNKADEAIVIRPATDTAFALGVAQHLIAKGIYDADYIKKFTDLPFLVRMDDLTLLRAKDVKTFDPYTQANLSNYTQIGGTVPSKFIKQDRMYISQSLRDEWNDYVVWDSTLTSPKVITRDQVGDDFTTSGLDPALTGSYQVTLLDDDDTQVEVRPIFDLIKEYVDDNFTPAKASEVCWAPQAAIEAFAQSIANNNGKTLFTVGMGPNHYWTNDLKDRAIFLIASLTGSVGNFGGNVGSYSGNYRLELFNGIGHWAAEDPFNVELDPLKQSVTKKYKKTESAHYYNYGDRPLVVVDGDGKELHNFTGDTHMPTPTKTTWWVDANSILGNSKWAYDVIVNTLPRIEMIVTNEWFWTKTCEYADIVLGVPSWIERKIPDIYGACTNPFFQMIVPADIDYIHDVRDDLETYEGVANKLSVLTGDTRFNDLWSFKNSDGRLDMAKYGQRVLDSSNTLKGYEWDKVLKDCKEGIPKYVMVRTTPRVGGYEQIHESKPFYTKTGRMEFFREEPEWRDAGENLPIFRETVDSTHYEPAVIVDEGSNPAIRPMGPADYGFHLDQLDAETRQVRNVVKGWSDLKNTKHPLAVADPDFKFILYTPKYRHACHSMAASQDYNAVYFGPFGDFYRRDKRKPYVGEGYVDMNPDDAKELGIEDGDYIWVDGDPKDRPYRGWKEGDDNYKVMRWLVRARYYPGIPRGTARSWFHMYGATHGSVEGHENRYDGLAKSPTTGYQAAYRYGSHQSITRAWLKPTLMTDSLVRKNGMGQTIGKGYHVEIHCATGAPKESFVKITHAEDGGIGGIGRWEPAAEGYRPTYENSKMSKYLAGKYGGD
ncbi:MAG: molybdopterin-dependent oxidoreductase [Candidatus Thermoplasmatota archaeon]|jgi:nitrate reductase alpha subunit|nr:molybdopterin-dependent oxidoreductase [Candidatus Thermoplasmatota archaeon]